MSDAANVRVPMIGAHFIAAAAALPANAEWTVDYTVHREAAGQQAGTLGERRDPDTLVAESRVSWQARPDAPDTFVPGGNLSVRDTRRKCAISDEGEITTADGELQLRRDAQGQAVEYSGSSIKSMPLNINGGRVSATQTVAVAWFGTADTLRPIGDDGAAAGSLKPGIVQWTWRFTR